MQENSSPKIWDIGEICDGYYFPQNLSNIVNTINSSWKSHSSPTRWVYIFPHNFLKKKFKKISFLATISRV